MKRISSLVGITLLIIASNLPAQTTADGWVTAGRSLLVMTNFAGAYSDFNAALNLSEAALETLRARHADGGLPLLRLPEQTNDLASIREAGGRLSAGATDVVILGTGGSSLGGQTLAQLAYHAVPVQKMNPCNKISPSNTLFIVR